MTREEKIRELIDKYVPCTCGEMYLSRCMAAPDCPSHSVNIEDVAIQYARIQSLTFISWVADSGYYRSVDGKWNVWDKPLSHISLDDLYLIFLHHQSPIP